MSDGNLCVAADADMRSVPQVPLISCSSRAQLLRHSRWSRPSPLASPTTAPLPGMCPTHRLAWPQPSVQAMVSNSSINQLARTNTPPTSESRTRLRRLRPILLSLPPHPPTRPSRRHLLSPLSPEPVPAQPGSPVQSSPLPGA